MSDDDQRIGQEKINCAWIAFKNSCEYLNAGNMDEMEFRQFILWKLYRLHYDEINSNIKLNFS